MAFMHVRQACWRRRPRSSRARFSCISAIKKADARRLIAIMGMGIKHGNTVRVEVEGEDEAEAAAQIEAFFKANL